MKETGDLGNPQPLCGNSNLLALAYAYEGRQDEVIEQVERARAFLSIERDALDRELGTVLGGE